MGVSIWHEAIGAGFLSMIELLLENDFALDSHSKFDKISSRRPFHYAILEGHLDFAEAMLDRGLVDVNVQDRDGFTAIYYAATIGRDDVISMLLKETEPLQTGPSEVSHLRQQNGALSRSLDDKGTQLRDALERESEPSSQVEYLKERLQTSLKKSTEYELQLDHALKARLKDQQKIMTAMERHAELDVDVPRQRLSQQG
uniref:Ankyrinlike protein putative n=1 Tax=Albugo laibachii Nc14 TaxID=890382 RepID=F0WRY1_9STRA|nr:ankyrinlike protein putative [Albugo laibachii Nc14]|eukprot:CCA24098.1 ankyrinlike protein putative [Albugo laibachii Nc14]